jgi:hypothetical protein
MTRFQKAEYSRRANRVIIRHGRGKVVAIIEIVSPGNKSSRNALRSFVEKAADILNQGISLLVVDLFPPTPRDPLGIHNAISEEFGETPMEIPPDKPLTVVSYIGGDAPIAYLEPIAIGDALPSAPIFLEDDDFVNAPLEQTYSRAWEVVPDVIKELMTPPAVG